MKARVIDALTAKSKLKRKIRQHLKNVGFIKMDDGSLGLASLDKSIVRSLHLLQRNDRIKSNNAFIQSNLPKLQDYFASGSEIYPEKIKPVLQKITSGTWESNLFRLASLSWSVPVSQGFGRRLRYLVWDESNGKLIGLIAIGDPVYNLSVRDNYIGWSSADRSKRLVNILDAYVLGAVPPYNSLLCGKLVASLLKTTELYNDFKKEYGKNQGIISGEHKAPRLLAITTSSSMGKSSVYNRLKLNGQEYLTPLGYTKGWGHFHIPENIFLEMRQYLRSIKHPYADLHQYGDGPNWRLRTIRAALDSLGFRADLLKHGVGREVFISSLANNSLKILATGKGKPDISSLLHAEEVSSLALERWVLPRSINRPEFKVWNNEQMKEIILTSQSTNPTEKQIMTHAVRRI